MASVSGPAMPTASISTYDALFSKPLTDAQRGDLQRDLVQVKRNYEEKIVTFNSACLTIKSLGQLSALLDDIEQAYREGKRASCEIYSEAQEKYVRQETDPFDAEYEKAYQEAAAKLKTCKKLTALEFPQELAVTHPDFVEFIFESKLAFWIACFRNSTQEGPERHGIKLDDTGEPHIKMGGMWTPWTVVKASVQYDKENEQLCSIAVPKQGYSYISPIGLVQKDRFDYDQIYPIERLSVDEYTRLRAEAHKFYDTNPEADPGVEKDAIYQVVTTYRTKWWGVDIPKAWYTKNLLANFPRHVTLRIIDKDRNVYSFGFEMKKEESDRMINLFPPSILKTGTTKVSVPDYEEPRQYDMRMTTSVPLATDRAKAILDFVSEHNRRGVRFNFMKQNCTKLTGETLALAGYRIDTRISFGALFGSFMPSLKDVPTVGPLLQAIADAIMYVVRPILNMIITYTPGPIKQVVRYIPEKIQTVLINLFILILGASRMTSDLPDGVEDERDNTRKLANFSRIIRTPLDLFREDSCDINYSQAIVDWQKGQHSTKEAAYRGGPNFNFI